MELKDIKSVYFVGAGGIGMSAIARYFLHKGLKVAGYDKTPSELTHTLEKEGMDIHYEENVQLIPAACKEPASTLVIYTPAIPSKHAELVYFRENGFEIQKRAQVSAHSPAHIRVFALLEHMEKQRLPVCVHILCTKVIWTVTPSLVVFPRTMALIISSLTIATLL